VELIERWNEAVASPWTRASRSATSGRDPGGALVVMNTEPARAAMQALYPSTPSASWP